MAQSLQRMGELLQNAALARTSQSQYSKTWKQWSTWCTVMGMPRVLSKSNESRNTAQLGAYAVYLWKYGMNRRQVGNTYSTIVGKLSAIRWFHRKLGYNPGVSTAHGLLMAGIKRMTDPVAKKHPLTP